MEDANRRLSILIAIACIDLMGGAMVFPLIPFYALHLGISYISIGIIMSSFFVAQLISAPLWGRVSDHYGRRPALLIGLGSLGIGYAIFGIANSMWLLLLCRVVQGAGGGTTGVTQAYVADTVPPRERARALAWLSAGTNVGTMLGPVIGSWAAYRGQYAPGVLAAALCALNLIFAWKWLPESRKPGQPVRERKPVWHGVWLVLRHPSGIAQRLTIVYALGMFGMSCMQASLGIFLNATFNVTEKTIGYFFLYTNVFNVIMRSALIGPIVDKMGEARTMRIGIVSLILGLVAYPFAPNLWVLALVIPLIPIGAALLFPATTALLSRNTPETELGAAMGIAQTFAGISRVVAPVLSTGLFEHLGHRSPFLAASVIVAIGSVLALQIEPATVPVAAESPAEL